jgi:hypothetical protein
MGPEDVRRSDGFLWLTFRGAETGLTAEMRAGFSHEILRGTQKGEQTLFDEIRYFFYITNRADDDAAKIVCLANGRCDQENVIEQLKNGVNVMRIPVDDLKSKWVYMVMASLA